MTRRGLTALATVIGCWAFGALPHATRAQVAGSTASAPLRLQVSIDVPEEGALIGDPAGLGFISGQALAAHGEFETFDLIFVIDQSESTAAPARSDLAVDDVAARHRCDGVPWLKRLGSLLRICPRASQETVLAAELQAVRTLLAQLDPHTTQVGVVAFSGDGDPVTPDAYVSAPLTSEYAQVERGLDAIEATGAQGRTNMLAGLQRATLELSGAERAYSSPRRSARKIMLLLSDGAPTLPVEASADENRRLTLAAAARAHELGIRIDSYGIGAEALSEPRVLVEMARATDGMFSAVLYPRDLRSIFAQVSFSELDELRITNRTTGRDAEYVLRSADGSFAALLEMAQGENAIEVHARSSDGVRQTHTRRVRFLGDAPAAALSPRLRAQRNRLMENRLADLRARRLAVEEARDEDVRSELRTRIDEGRDPAERTRDVEIEPRAPDVSVEGPAKTPSAPEL